MNDALREAARVDPDWAKKEARRQFVLKATVAGTLLALAIGAVSFVLSYHDAERITRVEQSACQVDAAGRECQKTKAEASRAASIAVTCIPFFRAGYPCPKPGSTAAQRQSKRHAQSGSGSAGALNNGSGVGQQGTSPTAEAPTPPHHGSTSPSAPHHPTSHPSPAPSPSPVPSAPEGQSGSGSSPATTEASAPAPESSSGTTGSTSSPSLIPSTVGATGTAAGEAVGGVGEVLHESLCLVRGLLRPCP
jgi:hypothetical protein